MSSNTTFCSAFAPYASAERSPGQGVTGAGGRQRSGPTGAAA